MCRAFQNSLTFELRIASQVTDSKHIQGKAGKYQDEQKKSKLDERIRVSCRNPNYTFFVRDSSQGEGDTGVLSEVSDVLHDVPQ